MPEYHVYAPPLHLREKRSTRPSAPQRIFRLGISERNLGDLDVLGEMSLSLVETIWNSTSAQLGNFRLVCP